MVNDSLNRNEILSHASLTDKELYIKVLIEVKKLGQNAQKWLLVQGKDLFVEICRDIASFNNSISECISYFCIQMEMTHKADGIESKINSSGYTTGKLLEYTEKQLQKNNFHLHRLKYALDMLDSESNHEKISIREVAGLLRAAVMLKNMLLQKQALTLFTSIVNNSEESVDRNLITSVQHRILVSMEPSLMKSYLQENALDFDLNSFSNHFNATNNLSLKMSRFMEATVLASKGNQIGSKHGCVICISHQLITKNDEMRRKYLSIHHIEKEFPPKTIMGAFDIVVGRGWNHNALEDAESGGGKKRMLHSEVHAIADTIRTYGEDLAFNFIFPNSAIVIVELHKDYSYDNAPPCPKCHTALRAVGVRHVYHSTDQGFVQELQLGQGNMELLDRHNVSIPLRVALGEFGMDCRRLTIAEERGKKEPKH